MSASMNDSSADLIVRIAGDVSGLQGSLDGATNSVKKFAGDVSTSSAGVNAEFKAIQQSSQAAVEGISRAATATTAASVEMSAATSTVARTAERDVVAAAANMVGVTNHAASGIASIASNAITENKALIDTLMTGVVGTVAKSVAAIGALWVGFKVGEWIGAKTGEDFQAWDDFWTQMEDRQRKADAKIHDGIGQMLLDIGRLATGDWASIANDHRDDLLTPLGVNAHPLRGSNTTFQAQFDSSIRAHTLDLQMQQAQLQKNGEAVHELKLKEIDLHMAEMQTAALAKTTNEAQQLGIKFNIGLLKDEADAVENLRYKLEQVKDTVGLGQFPDKALSLYNAFGSGGNSLGVPNYDPAHGPLGQQDFANTLGNAYGPDIAAALAQENEAYRKMAKDFADTASSELQIQIEGQLADAFGALFKHGADGFMRQLTREFDGLMSSGAKTFVDTIFGHKTQQNPDGTYGANHTKDPTLVGGLIDATNHPNAKTYVGAGLGVVAIGYGAYQQGMQAPSNAVASGAMSGAASGAGIGNMINPGVGAVYGAVIGAIVGAIAGEMGALKTRSEYQYADPYFDKSGNVHLSRSKNLQPAQQEQMIADAQGTVDSYRNQYTRLLMTLGVSGNSPFKPTQLNSYIQDNPSSHFMEHFQQWMSQTLPREIAAQFKDELKGGFGNLGLSGTQFDSMWAKYSGLDPSKSAPMLQGLADALKMMQDSSKFFGKSASGRMSDLTAAGNLTFAQSLDEGDKKILDFAAHLKDLVGEDQINAAKELGQMEADRAAQEKAFVQSLVDTMKAAHDASEALNQSLAVRLIHNADGSPDYASLAKYYQTDANSALTALTGAKNPQDAQTAWNRFLSDLDKVSQAGYGINTKTGDDYTKWAQQQIKNDQSYFDAMLKQMGNDVANKDAAFLSAIQPSVDAFKDSLGGVNVTIGDFGSAADGATVSADRLSGSFDRLTAKIDALAARADSSGFVSRTAASRVA